MPFSMITFRLKKTGEGSQAKIGLDSSLRSE
jgi:hypothetical protein